MHTMRLRVSLWLAMLAAALAGGCLLSGWTTLRLLGLEQAAGWETYPRYLQARRLPQLRPYLRKVKAGGLIGFGVPLGVWALVSLGLLRRPKPLLHGDARFARHADLRGKGLLGKGDDGIVVGASGGQLIRLRGQQFAILAAPTRSGKGAGVVVPTLLDYRESVVVLDIKQENFALTSGWRARQGHAVYLFNPFAEDRRSHRWNPLTYVSADPAFRISDLMAIAAMLYPEGADEQKFWVSQSRNAFVALALYLFEKRDDDAGCGFPQPCTPTLGALYRLATGPGGDLRAHLQDLASRAFVGPATGTAFANLLSQADDTFASIMGSLRQPLNAWLNPVLDAATSADDFRLDDVRRRRMSIYVGIQPGKLAESRLLLNLFFSQLLHANTRELPRNDPTLRHQCLLLMDEFTAIGRIDILPSAIAYMAGYNLRLLPVVQSMAQLDATYGKEDARTLLTNHALQVVYAPREQRDANDYSEMLGYRTVRRQQVTRGREVTRSTVEERRALMLPQELKALGPDKAILLYEGLPHPVLCTKLRYYRDRRFTSRLLPEVDVPLLDV